jgi:hypothetical protein
MTVSSRLINSGTPGPPCARSHYSCARTGISQLKAARRNRSSTLIILISSSCPPLQPAGKADFTRPLNLLANRPKDAGRFNPHNRHTAA